MLQTALHDWHTAAGARMVDFADWHMPIQYSSIVEEHHAVRKQAGLFDIAHMGRIWFSGPDQIPFLDHLLTNHVVNMKLGQVRYSLLCREDGGILDDVLVYRFEDRALLVVNGANRLKVVDWINQHKDSYDVNVDDATCATFMLAIQGPQAEAILAPKVATELNEIKYYYAVQTEVLGHSALVSRTGYTGEDGFEIIVDNEHGLEVWTSLIEAKNGETGESQVTACGLGCRDTLRLEAGMPLYGHEMDESMDPLTAGLRFAVKLKKDDFIGREAIAAIDSKGNLPQRVGVELEGRRIAREGALLMLGDQQIGHISSGTFSPTFEKSIAMGYVEAASATVGTEVEVDIRGKRVPAQIVALPFYKR